MPDARSAPDPDGAAGLFALALDTAPMEAMLAASLPGEGSSGDEPEWRFEPKWDGFRCLVFRAGDAVELRAKSGKPLGRYFPEIVEAVRGIGSPTFVVDGELVIAIDGRLSFDALQMRLHPAQSRITTLSCKTPAKLVLFDMLASEAEGSLLARPLTERSAALDRLMTTVVSGRLERSTSTRDRAEAERWLGEAEGTRTASSPSA